MKKDFQIIFVQLGSAKAAHLWKNISSIKNKWPEYDVVLITDSNEHVKKAKKLKIGIWEFVPTQEISDLMSNSAHNHEFRQGFWNYSVLRLFAVLEYSNIRPQTSLIHLESDVTVFPNFPFSTLSSRPLPTWLRFNESHDVGSIFTIPDVDAAKWLKQTFIKELKKNSSLTDMTLLNCVSRRYPELMEFLPVAADPSDPLIRYADRNSPEAERITETSSIYNGIFDSAPIGMWLLGQDPRNHLGRIIRFKELAESYIQPQFTKYSFNSDAQTLVTSTGTQIFNLHVHSKEISYFDSRRGRKIAARVKDSINATKTSTFNFRSFLALSTDFFNRNGIFGVIRKIKSFLTTSP
jgi:hypothetical protein